MDMATVNARHTDWNVVQLGLSIVEGNVARPPGAYLLCSLKDAFEVM